MIKIIKSRDSEKFRISETDNREYEVWFEFSMIINQISNPLYSLFWIYGKYRGLLIKYTLEVQYTWEGSLNATVRIKWNYGLGMSKKEFIIWFTSSGLVKEPPWINTCPELRIFIIRILLPLQIQLLGVHSKYLVTVSLIIKRSVS